MVILVIHPIHSLLALILMFVQTGFFLILLSVDYIGNLLLVVYVGAVAILFLFVIMMLNIRLLPINISIITYLPLSIFMVIGLMIQQFLTLRKYNFFNIQQHDLIQNLDHKFTTDYIHNIIIGVIKPFTHSKINYFFNLSWNTWQYPEYINLIDTFYSLSSLEAIGQCLYIYTYLYVIFAAIVLLVAMMGSISLTLYHQVGVSRQNISKQILRNSFSYLTH